MSSMSSSSSSSSIVADDNDCGQPRAQPCMPDHAAPTPSLDDDDNDGLATAAAVIATREGTVQASSAREAPHSIVFSSSGTTMATVSFFPAEPNIVVLILLDDDKNARDLFVAHLAINPCGACGSWLA